jgi:parallel beta-helix repeat protein
MYLDKKGEVVIVVIIALAVIISGFLAISSLDNGNSITGASIGLGDIKTQAVSCGDEITSDTTLGDNLGPCTAPWIDGLSIGADNLELDCGGFSIIGDPLEDGTIGIYNSRSFKNIIIKNCIITNFSTGIKLDQEANNTKIYNTTFKTNTGDGIYAAQSGYLLIQNNTFINQTNDGIQLVGMSHTLIQNSTFENNGISDLSSFHALHLDTGNGSTNHTFHTNTLYNNSISIEASVANTRFYNNIFNYTPIINNNAVTIWNTTYDNTTKNIVYGGATGGNWWHNYTGNDTNDDGIGDDSDYQITATYKDEEPLVTIYQFTAPNLDASFADYLEINSTFNETNPMTSGSNHSTRQNITFYNSTSGNKYLTVEAYFNQSVDLSTIRFYRNLTAENNVIAFAVSSLSSIAGIEPTHTIYLFNNNSGDGVTVCLSAETLDGVSITCNNKIQVTLQNITDAVNIENVTVTMDGDYYKITNISGTGVLLGSNSSLVLWDETDPNQPHGDALKHPDSNISFFANYTDSAGNLSSNANCTITYDNGSAFSMVYDSNKELFVANTSNLNEGITEWNVTCSALYKHTMFLNDSVNITTCPRYINNDYTLALNHTATGNCLIINSSNVNIDGAGYFINGDGTGSGIVSHGYKNITISNINIFNLSYAIYLNFSDNVTISQSNLTEFNDYGLLLTDTNNTYSSNLNISSNQLASSSLYVLYNSTSNNLTNCELKSTNQNIAADHQGNLSILNSSFQRDNMLVTSTGNVYVQWYLQYNVTADDGSPIPSAIVNTTYNFTFTNYSLEVDDDGLSPTIIATEFYENSVGKYYESPVKALSYASGFLQNLTYTNLTITNSTLTKVNLSTIPDVATNDCGTYTTDVNLSGGITYANSTYCIIAGANNIVINGNGSVIYGNDTSASYGFYGFRKKNVTLHNITFINFTNYQVYLVASDNFTFYNSSFYVNDSSNLGIYLYYSDDNNFTNNTIFTETTNGYGVYSYRSNRNIFFDNQITTIGKTSPGLYLTGQSNSNSILSNTINTTGASTRNIQLITSLSNTLSQNTIYANGSSSRGIDLTTSNSSTIFNNSINPAVDGIVISTSKLNNISNNVLNTSGDGIVLVGGQQNIVDLNLINSTSEGLFLSGSDYGTLRQNQIISDAVGAFLQIGAVGNNFSNNNFTVSSSGTYAVRFAGTDTNNTFINDYLNSSGNTNIYSAGNLGDNNYFINCSYNRNSITAAAPGRIYVQWYLDLTVQNISLDAINGSLININNSLNELEVSNLNTNTSGQIPRQTLTEFFENSTAKYYQTPQNITAIRITPTPAYRLNDTAINLTKTNSTAVTLIQQLNNDPILTNAVMNLTVVYTDTNYINANVTYTDADSDLGNITFIWYVNNNEIKRTYNTSVTGTSIVDNISLTDYDYNKGDVIRVNVTANDTYLTVVVTNTTTIPNKPPAVTIPAILPNPAYTNNTLTTNTTVTDDDGDLTQLWLDWYVDDALIKSENWGGLANGTVRTSTLASSNFVKNNIVNVTVIAYDGTSYSTRNWSINLNITNLLPVYNLTIGNFSMNTDQQTTLNLSTYFTDGDGDDLNYTIVNVSTVSFAINSTTKILTITSNSTTGSVSTFINATDGQNSTAGSNFTITVSAPSTSTSTSSGGRSGGPSKVIAKKEEEKKPVETDSKSTSSSGSECPTGQILVNGTCVDITEDPYENFKKLEEEFDQMYPTSFTKVFGEKIDMSCLTRSPDPLFKIKDENYIIALDALESKETVVMYELQDNILKLIWLVNEKEEKEICTELNFINQEEKDVFSSFNNILTQGNSLFTEFICFNSEVQSMIIIQDYVICEDLINKEYLINVNIVK